MKKVGNFNKKDIFDTGEKDKSGKPIFFYNGEERSFDYIVRILPYDKNAKLEL